MASGLAAAPAQAGITLDPNAVPGRTQVTLRYQDGGVVATHNSGESRPALSLSKLYLGYWVLKYGAPEDKGRVEEMIRVSHDGIASSLDAKYPQAIPGIIGEYRLGQTHYNGFWGNTTTSTDDVTRFLAAIVGDPAAEPLLRGMRNAAPVAADGYRQDFGTARIPGVTGTKFGWADDRTVHASASFGNGYTIAANTYGSPATLTQDVLGAIRVTLDTGLVPPAMEAQWLSWVPAPLRPQVRQAVRDVDAAVAQARGQLCGVLRQAGSSHLMAGC